MPPAPVASDRGPTVPDRGEPLIFVISGEPSGDNLAGRLMAALKRQTAGRVRFAGVGGPQSERQGLASLFPMGDLAVMGLAEVLPHLPLLARRLRQTVEAARQLRPDAIVTIDSPGFCLRVAHRMRGSGIPLIHYVAPQLWAWRPGRAKALARCIDHLMVLLPFEPEFFADFGLSCSYVGHAVLESAAERGDGPAFRARRGLPPGAPVVCVLPGSRKGEVRRLLPVFGRALDLLRQKFPDLHASIPVVASVADEVTAITRGWPVPAQLVKDPAERFDAFAASDMAITKSGTVTLELAIANVPMIVAYRTNAATAFLARRMIRVPHVSLVNLLAKREVVPEFLQENCTPARLADAAGQILRSKDLREAQRQGFRDVMAALGGSGISPSDRAAETVLRIIRERRKAASGG